MHSYKIKLDLNGEALQEKLNLVCDQLEPEAIKAAISDIESLERQMKEIDARIKVITNRCQNELLPRQKAVCYFH